MVELDVLADTVFRDEAAKAVDAFVSRHVCPVERAQIAGLRQIAANEPGKVLDFAKHQRDKAAKKLEGTKNEQKRARLDGEVAFWDLVSRLCGTSGTGPAHWSLASLAEETASPDCRVGKKPHGSAPAEEHKRYNDARDRLAKWRKLRQSEDYPVFFARFCAHYLYRMSQQPQEERRGDR